MDFIVHQSLKIVESGVIPDHAIRAAIRALSKKRLIQEGRYDPEQGAHRYMDVLNMLKKSEIAVETDKANEQHYELPTEFFQAVLGKRLKYSACYFPTKTTTL
ncbi:SAM-dependent methyltransferase, partial [Acinetobacter baumannii]